MKNKITNNAESVFNYEYWTIAARELTYDKYIHPKSGGEIVLFDERDEGTKKIRLKLLQETETIPYFKEDKYIKAVDGIISVFEEKFKNIEKTIGTIYYTKIMKDIESIFEKHGIYEDVIIDKAKKLLGINNQKIAFMYLTRRKALFPLSVDIEKPSLSKDMQGKINEYTRLLSIDHPHRPDHTLTAEEEKEYYTEEEKYKNDLEKRKTLKEEIQEEMKKYQHQMIVGKIIKMKIEEKKTHMIEPYEIDITKMGDFTKMKNKMITRITEQNTRKDEELLSTLKSSNDK